MFKLDDDFLLSLGLSAMPAEEKEAFLQHLYEELELRVGTRLSDGLSAELLREFDKLVEAGDEAGALHWLETNRPDYKKVVAEELERLRQEVVANKDKIVGE